MTLKTKHIPASYNLLSCKTTCYCLHSFSGMQMFHLSLRLGYPSPLYTAHSPPLCSLHALQHHVCPSPTWGLVPGDKFSDYLGLSRCCLLAFHSFLQSTSQDNSPTINLPKSTLNFCVCVCFINFTSIVMTEHTVNAKRYN